jgi:hypothetical protein
MKAYKTAMTEYSTAIGLGPDSLSIDQLHTWQIPKNQDALQDVCLLLRRFGRWISKAKTLQSLPRYQTLLESQQRVAA